MQCDSISTTVPYIFSIFLGSIFNAVVPLTNLVHKCQSRERLFVIVNNTMAPLTAVTKLYIFYKCDTVIVTVVV